MVSPTVWHYVSVWVGYRTKHVVHPKKIKISYNNFIFCSLIFRLHHPYYTRTFNMCNILLSEKPISVFFYPSFGVSLEVQTIVCGKRSRTVIGLRPVTLICVVESLVSSFPRRLGREYWIYRSPSFSTSLLPVHTSKQESTFQRLV